MRSSYLALKTDAGKSNQFIETEVKFEDGRRGKVSADLKILDVKTFPIAKKAA